MNKFLQKENQKNTKIFSKTELIVLIKQKNNEQLNNLSLECFNTLLNNPQINEDFLISLFLMVNFKKNIKTFFNALEIVEILDKVLKKSSELLLKEIDKRDKFIIYETLKIINYLLDDEGCFNLNLDCLSNFIINCLKRNCKLEISYKLLSLNTLKKLLEFEESRKKIINEILYNLFLLSGGKSNVKTKFIIMCFESSWFDSFTEVFEIIFNQPESNFNNSEDLILNILYNSEHCKSSFLFCLCFLKYFLETREEKLFSIFLRVFKEIVQSQRVLEDEKTGILCKKLFNLNNSTDAKKFYTRKSFLFCLDILLKKHHTKKNLIAKTLNKMNLKGLVTNKKRTIKIAKILLKGENPSIFECGIRLISNTKESQLLNYVENVNCPLKKAILFEYTKHLNLEKIYIIYLELLENKQDIDFIIEDMKTFSRAFYVFHSKEVAQFLSLEDLQIEDVYTADLALWYSKYHPTRVDEVQVASFFLQTEKQFLISKNINFFVKLISILNNLSGNLNFSLKKNLISIFKELLFYIPYTKEVGLFLANVNCNKFVIQSKTEYSLVVLASCNHIEFKNRFLESHWSPLKDRALIYILSYQPHNGINYKWRLIEIMKDSDYLNILELLIFLTETFKETFLSAFGDEISNFYFSFVDENQKLLFSILESENKSIVLQCSTLIYTAVKNKCLLPEIAIPPFISYTLLIPPDINQFQRIIIKNINKIVEKRSLKGEETFLFNLFAKLEEKEQFLENLNIEVSVLDLLLKIFQNFKHKKLIQRKIEEFQISIEDGEILEKLSKFLK